MNDSQNKILGLVKLKGPVLPADVAKMIHADTLIASAMLSELTSSKTLKASNLKVGGSPLYFLPEQAHLLENYLNNLPGKEREAFDYLKKKQIVNDSKLDLAFRVALRNLKDFAVPIRVTADNKEYLFWRYHLVPSEEAIERIKEIISKVSEKAERAVKAEKAEKKEEKRVKKEEKKEAEAKAEKSEEKQEKQEIEKPVPALEKQEKEAKPKLPKIKVDKKIEAFREKITEYAKTNNIMLIEETGFDKDELRVAVSINSDLGKLPYLIVAKNKKKISEADISLAYNQGQEKKMPVLFLTNGAPTKKALEYMDNLKGQLLFRKL